MSGEGLRCVGNRGRVVCPYIRFNLEGGTNYLLATDTRTALVAPLRDLAQGQSGTSTIVAKDSRDLFLGSWAIITL